MRSVSNLKADLQRRIRDKTNGIIESADATAALNEAIRFLKSLHEFPGTKQRADLSVYQRVYEYPAASGYKSTIDLRREDESVEFDKRTSKEFWRDLNFESQIYADDNYNETRILLVKADNLTSAAVLHNCDSLTSEGTWAAVSGSGASNLTLDEEEYREGGGAINFDCSSATVPAIENSTFTAVDLSDYEDKAYLFVQVYLPTVSNITSVTLRWGSSSSAYWSQTVTTNFLGRSLATGWNQLGFAWNGATETGTADASAVDYLRLTITYSSSTTDTDFRLDDVFAALPYRLKHNHYSKNFIKTSAGAYQAEISADDDTTILEDWQDELLLAKAEERAFMTLRDYTDAAEAGKRFAVLFAKITNDEVSERAKPTDRYYYM